MLLYNKWLRTFCCFFFSCTTAFAQTGPNSPTTRSNITGVGTLAWSNPNQINNSDNNYATVATAGTSNYLRGTRYNFAIAAPANINGIVVGIEKATTASTAVAVLNNWTFGTSKTISAGVSRCLIVAVVLENGLGARNITSLTYGGQAMTQITEIASGNSGFTGKIEYWRLMEAGIQAAGSTNFVITYDGTALQENYEACYSAVFQYVNQLTPVSAFVNMSNTSDPLTLSPALATRLGGMSISTIFCGNPGPSTTVGSGNNYTIGSGFTEVVDTYSANPSFPTSGGSIQISNKASAAIGSEAPQYNFNGTINRQVVSCLHLQPICIFDNEVRIVKNLVITGNNYAQTTLPWSQTEAVVNYGGTTDLWGTTWTVNDINSDDFGAAISAIVQFGTARVDHIRITVYSSSTLPVELMNFSGEVFDGSVRLKWRTASERNNKVFLVERSADMISFETIGSVDGNGTTQVFSDYNFEDRDPLQGMNYYRLKQVDEDGTFQYSKHIVIDRSESLRDLTVYPNPSPDGIFKINTELKNMEGMQIYGSDLRLIKQVCSDEEKEISLQGLPDGIYYLIYADGGAQKIKRLEKMSRSR